MLEQERLRTGSCSTTLATKAPISRKSTRSMPRAPIVALLKVLFAVAAVIFYRVDIKSRYREKGFPKNYVVIAKKPL